MNNETAACRCKYGFIGVGNMASALIAGLMDTGTVRPDNIMVFDIDGTRCAPFADRGALTAESAAPGQCVVRIHILGGQALSDAGLPRGA